MAKRWWEQDGLDLEGMRTAAREAEQTEGGGGDGWDEDGLNRWEDNVAYVTLGTEPNAPLAYALEMELHHPTISKLGEPGGRLERERESVRLRGPMLSKHGNLYVLLLAWVTGATDP